MKGIDMDPATIIALLDQAAAAARLFERLITIAQDANGGPLTAEQIAIIQSDKKAVDTRLETLETQAEEHRNTRD